MTDIYRKLYFYLFNCITDAVEALRKNNAAEAESILVSAQQKTEERYISENEKS